MLTSFKITVLFIIMAAALAGCGENKSPAGAETKQESARKAIMEINGRLLYEDDFYDFAGTVLKEMGGENMDNPEVKDKLLKDFTEHNMLLSEARRRGISINNERINRILDSFHTEEGVQDLKVYSGSYYTDHTKLAKLMQERLLVESLLNGVVNSQIVITEKELKDRYNTDEAKQKPETKAHILHIFTTKEETAEKAMNELRKGLSFNEVAERYSEGPEKKQSGDLGFISDGDFPEIFAEAFRLPTDKYSGIVKSDYGYHIFFVKKILRPKKINYEDVKSKIYMELYLQQQEDKTREFIDELYKNADIKYLDDVDLGGYAGGRGGGK